MTKKSLSDKKTNLSPAAVAKYAKMAADRRGKPMSAETKAKISATLTGKPRTDEHRANLSASLKNKSPWNKGKKITSDVYVPTCKPVKHKPRRITADRVDHNLVDCMGRPIVINVSIRAQEQMRIARMLDE